MIVFFSKADRLRDLGLGARVSEYIPVHGATWLLSTEAGGLGASVLFSAVFSADVSSIYCMCYKISALKHWNFRVGIKKSLRSKYNNIIL